ncbi:methyltransferase [Flavivirga spongiicola]|uniref:Methyltransferase n=1 Tax=Flavivirga spongiicola TaxID=421621 RepID=A0ABU7XQ83_9FLAO|nr:methyltransferase [Flavivirga sp. MEBiC05379]MDO5977711.1 methyltransferase [Flavivirga sp. MEBiC05379]
MEIPPTRNSGLLFRIMISLRNLIKRITNPLLKTGLRFYYRKPRKYNYDGISVMVHPDVFPPHLTFSTKILLDYISNIDLKGKSILELGCGSGIISLLASKKGGNVIATDINKTALEYLQKASIENNLTVNCIYSNLFDNLNSYTFDYIIINPPYYPKHPKSIEEQAWFCGTDFNYFKNLFKQLSNRLNDKNILMILSIDCDLKSIKNIAKRNNLKLTSIFEKKIFGEHNFIFKITPII